METAPKKPSLNFLLDFVLKELNNGKPTPHTYTDIGNAGQEFNIGQPEVHRAIDKLMTDGYANKIGKYSLKFPPMAIEGKDWKGSNALMISPINKSDHVTFYITVPGIEFIEKGGYTARAERTWWKKKEFWDTALKWIPICLSIITGIYAFFLSPDKEINDKVKDLQQKVDSLQVHQPVQNFFIVADTVKPQMKQDTSINKK